MRTLAISDIHGCLDSFKGLLKKLKLTKTDQLFLIGDFIDRGPNSKGVIDYIWQLQRDQFNIHCLRGNHEQMLLDSQSNFEKARNWKHHGGSTTLESFQAHTIGGISREHLSWMSKLPLFLEHDRYIFVHAGLNFDFPNPLEGLHSMLWIRRWYDDINYPWLGDRIIVHGHTPTETAEIKIMLKEVEHTKVLNIDSGCVFKHKGLGHLCGIDLTNRELYFQKRIE